LVFLIHTPHRVFAACYHFYAKHLATERTHPITLGMSGFSAEQIILEEYHDSYGSMSEIQTRCSVKHNTLMPYKNVLRVLMYVPCIWYSLYPDQQMHYIYKQYFIYRKHSYVFRCTCIIFRQYYPSTLLKLQK